MIACIAVYRCVSTGPWPPLGNAGSKQPFVAVATQHPPSTSPIHLIGVAPQGVSLAYPEIDPRTGPRYWGVGVRLGNSEGWKPQKVGGCGWSRCPRNRILSHAAKDMAYSWFVVVGIWSFWGPFWAVRGSDGKKISNGTRFLDPCLVLAKGQPNCDPSPPPQTHTGCQGGGGGRGGGVQMEKFIGG